MYLTRAYLNPRQRGALRLLGNPQRLHAAVLAGFPEPLDQPGDRILWRLDADNPVRPILWIVSPYEPDLTHLTDQAGWPTLPPDRQWQTRDYKPLLDRIDTGQHYAFRLTANPTRNLKPPPGAKRGKRVQHTTAHHQLRWLQEKAEQAGFTIRPSTAHLPGTDEPAPDIRLIHRDNAAFRKHRDDTNRVTITQVGYLGTLQVTNPDTLRTTLTTGLGHARAYGCGLLTLAKTTE